MAQRNLKNTKKF